MTPPGPPRHRGLFWAAIVVALAALVAGSAFAYVTYAAGAGPDGAVTGYFAALARGDTSAALGFGDLPAGPTQLLTASVLRAQLNVAPIRHVEIVSTDESGDTATVGVRYVLDFADGPQRIGEKVAVVRHSGSWRLARTAAATQLRLQEAGDRATIMGARLPRGTLLIFPGAVPIKFDSPSLRLRPGARSVKLAAQPQTLLAGQLTEAGSGAVRAAVEIALRACLAGTKAADPRCPLPAARAVPGTLRAIVSAADVRRAAVIELAPSPSGVVAVSGTIKLAGRYTALDFENQPVMESGTVSLPLTASAYATDPITINWAEGT
jgi:hypothetical protein